MQHLLLYSFANYEGDSWPPRSSPHNAGRMGRDVEEAGLLVWGARISDSAEQFFNLPLNRGRFQFPWASVYGRSSGRITGSFHPPGGPGRHTRRHTVGQRWRPKTSPSKRGREGGGIGVTEDRYQEAANWTDSKVLGPHKLNQCLKPTEEPHACQAPPVAAERCRLFPTNCSHQSVINGYWKEPFTGAENHPLSAPK